MKPFQESESSVFDKVFSILKKYWIERSDGEFVEFMDSEVLKEKLKLENGQGGQDWDQILNWIEIYLKYAVKTNHPGFRNRMWSGANLPSVLGEIVSAISNTSACTYESAPVSTLMEKYLINEMLDLVGFKNGEGQMTTGSSNANLVAMLAARNKMNPGGKNLGLFGSTKLKAYVSVDAHYSIDKAANLLGIGIENIEKISVNNKGQLDVKILEKKLRENAREGHHPFFVCATAGTTVRGGYDSIPELLMLRSKYHFWLHVDGAWGGAVIFHEKLREQFLNGIEAVDSFTWDFHKMPGTALICNILLFNNNAGILSNTCGVGDTSYLFHEADNQTSDNLGLFSMQCGRHVDSLKWFLDWKFYGHEGFSQRVGFYWELCEYAEKKINNSMDLEMIVPRDSFNVCFRFITPKGIDADRFNQGLRKELYQKQLSLIGSGTINQQFTLRLLFTNPDLKKSDVKGIIDHIILTGKHLLKSEIITIKRLAI